MSLVEDVLPLEWRQRYGQFSTPLRLVHLILGCAGYTPTADLRGVRLLDPACGAGNFLIAAADRLLRAAARNRWSRDVVRAALAQNLWGLEVDAASCALAELRLRSVLPADLADVPLHLHQVDSLALAPASVFDIVVSNPPYLSGRRSDLSAYHWLAGQRDTYLLFVDLACRMVKVGGMIGLVLPDPFLARANAEQARALLLRDFTLRRLLHIERVFHAYVGTVVLVARRASPPPGQCVGWARLRVSRWHASTAGKAIAASARGGAMRHGTVPQTVLSRQPLSALRYLLDEHAMALIERISAGQGMPPMRLCAVAHIGRGEELAKCSPRLMRQPGPNMLPVLLGGCEIRPFAVRFHGYYLPAAYVRKPRWLYQAPKILVVKSTDRLTAALDTTGYVTLQTLYLVHAGHDIIDLPVLLALLNSRLLRVYLLLTSTRYKLVQPQIEQHVLGDLPLPALSARDAAALRHLAWQLHHAYQEPIAEAQGAVSPSGGLLLSSSLTGKGGNGSTPAMHCAIDCQRVEWNGTADSLEAELNALVNRLYGITEAELALLEHAGLTLP